MIRLKLNQIARILMVLCLTQPALSGEIKADKIEEFYSKKVKVSGEFYLGLQYLSSDESKQLNVLFPDDAQGVLCVDISGIDGRYKARLETSLSAPVSGWYRIKFHSRFEDELREYKSSDLAIKAGLADSCEGRGVSYLISAWGRDSSEGGAVMFIRSDARKDVAMVSGDGPGIKCRKIKSGYRVSYDKMCDFKGVDLPKVKEIVIKRKNLRKMPDEVIKLAY